jgi:hypothetical protein
MANKYMKKMFNILKHKGNANENYIKILSHPNQNGSHQENKQQMLSKTQEKNESLCTVGGSVN